MNCTWKYNIRRDEYTTSCGKVYWLSNESNPQEEGFEYCPFCGYALEQADYDESEKENL